MSRVFVIPDVHLKPWMLKKASDLMNSGSYDAAILLGDLVDDWGKQTDISLYERTFNAVEVFIREHPDTFYCYGNHDISYIWDAMETGYSLLAKDLVIERLEKIKKMLPPENIAFIHRIDNVIFSHAGLTKRFIERYFDTDKIRIDDMLLKINLMGEAELWDDESPIWARPQYNKDAFSHKDILQVVGHTPVKEPVLKDNILSVDIFSTLSNGMSIGNSKLIWVDTVNKNWGYAE